MMREEGAGRKRKCVFKKGQFLDFCIHKKIMWTFTKLFFKLSCFEYKFIENLVVLVKQEVLNKC